ncbi:MAG: DinB family protein [Acidobacteria bacterium]|nr:DinB family protein [Acidobacteriota bacterium]MBI3427373.1 DinB family protein [Acidobacteriota bacterium]
MSDLSNTVATGFSASFQEFAKRVHTLAEPLSEEQFWRKPYPYGNSFGHLVLHLTGNLSYYIGAQIAGTGYVRDRDREFTDSQPLSKAEALRRFDETIDMVVRTLAAQTAASWSQAYEAVGAAMCPNRFSIVARCSAHLFHHIGQMIYLTKEFAKES